MLIRGVQWRLSIMPSIFFFGYWIALKTEKTKPSRHLRIEGQYNIKRLTRMSTGRSSLWPSIERTGTESKGPLHET